MNEKSNKINEIGSDGRTSASSQSRRTAKASDIVMFSVFILFIFGFSIAALITKDRDFSEMENRNLAQKPEFSFKNLKEGKFTSDLESYISDQMFLKDALVSLKTDCDRAALKTSLNGILQKTAILSSSTRRIWIGSKKISAI